MESSLRFNVHDYSEPAIVGTMFSFYCSQPEEVLIGPNTTTCMDDGQWVPDPLQLQISCKGIEALFMASLVHTPFIGSNYILNFMRSVLISEFNTFVNWIFLT